MSLPKPSPERLQAGHSKLVSSDQRADLYKSDLLILEPTASPHRQSFIVLHGRGDFGPSFGRDFVHEDIDGYKSMRAAFPHARFIFPTASARASERFKGWKLNQWFDYYSLETPGYREDLQAEGLKETTLVLHELVGKEIACVGAENVILGGLSNGGAAALIAGLLWTSARVYRPLGGVFGLCTWLPYSKKLNNRIEEIDAVDAKLESDAHNVARASRTEIPLEWLQDQIGFRENCKDIPESAYKKSYMDGKLPAPGLTVEAEPTTPIYLAHGTEDNIVPVHLFEDAAKTMRALGHETTTNTYNDLAHWYSELMLRHLVKWVNDNVQSTQEADECVGGAG